MMRAVVLAVLLVAGLAAGAGPVRANASAHILSFDQLERVNDADLAEQRGGFVYQGVEVLFGAEIRSYIDNELVLQTNVSWGPDGANIVRFASGSLTKMEADSVNAGVFSSGGPRFQVGNEDVFVADGGQTAFVQRGDGMIQNILLNTASNVALRQEVDVRLDLGNFEPFQQGVMAERLGTGLTDMVQSAVLPLFSH